MASTNDTCCMLKTVVTDIEKRCNVTPACTSTSEGMDTLFGDKWSKEQCGPLVQMRDSIVTSEAYKTCDCRVHDHKLLQPTGDNQVERLKTDQACAPSRTYRFTSAD